MASFYLNFSKYDPLQIEEIILEDQEMVVISDDLCYKLEMFKNLESLGLNRCELTTLKNMPNLKKLARLTLDGNNLKVTTKNAISYQ